MILTTPIRSSNLGPSLVLFSYNLWLLPSGFLAILSSNVPPPPIRPRTYTNYDRWVSLAFPRAQVKHISDLLFKDAGKMVVSLYRSSKYLTPQPAILYFLREPDQTENEVLLHIWARPVLSSLACLDRQKKRLWCLNYFPLETS